MLQLVLGIGHCLSSLYMELYHSHHMNELEFVNINCFKYWMNWASVPFTNQKIYITKCNFHIYFCFGNKSILMSLDPKWYLSIVTNCKFLNEQGKFYDWYTFCHVSKWILFVCAQYKLVLIWCIASWHMNKLPSMNKPQY